MIETNDELQKDIILEVKDVSKLFEIYKYPRYFLYQILFGFFKTYYKEFWALRNVSFHLKKGESLGIIGRNGSGKSTLLQIISGILYPTTGTVKTKGRIAALLELGSGFHPEFTGRENVYMNAAILGLSKAEIDERFEEIADFADIGNFIDQPVRIYSSGMMVRLAFSVQVMVEPDILIVDEALAVGDALFQQKCYARMERLTKKGCSVILVSHSLEAISRFCQKCIYLKDNDLFYYGDTQTAITYYRQHLQELELQKTLETMQNLNLENNFIDSNGKYIYRRILPQDTESSIKKTIISRIDILGLESPNILKSPCQIIVHIYAQWDHDFIQNQIKKHKCEENISIELSLTDQRSVYLYSYNIINHNMYINPLHTHQAHLTFTIDIPKIMNGNIFFQTTLELGIHKRLILEQSKVTCLLHSQGANPQRGLVNFPTQCEIVDMS